MIMDLFNPTKQSLKVHESPNKGVWIADLTEEVLFNKEINNNKIKKHRVNQSL